MEKVRPPSLETTNQQILSAENARTIYLKLRSGGINAPALLTLCLVFYTLPDNGMGNDGFEVCFKKRVSKTAFLEALNFMEEETMEQKMNALLPDVTWEPVDGQHIQLALYWHIKTY